MATFEAGAIPSSFGNVLFNPMAVDQAVRANQQNDLLMQGERQRLDFASQKNPLEILQMRQALGLDPSPVIDQLQQIYGGGKPGGAGSFEQGMSKTESGGDPSKVNAGGYSGNFQFGAARLADLGVYHPAEGEDLSKNEWKGSFSIPGFAVATHDDFLKNAAAQHAVFGAHVADIDKAIAATPGADKMDANGLRAVAHLGGVAGMQKFVATGGLYDPADANGTRLSSYYAKFAQGGAPALQQAFGSPHGPGGPPAGGGVAQRTGGTDFAGPGAPTGPAPGFDAAGNPLPAGTWDASPVTTPAAAPGAPAPAPTPAAAQTGLNSPQVQQAQQLQQRATQIEMAAARAPNDPRVKATAAAMVQDLRARAQLLLQADSVTVGPDGVQTHSLTGKQDNAATPSQHWVYDANRGMAVETGGNAKPEFAPSPRLQNVPGIGVVQSKPGGGATIVAPFNPAGIAEQSAATAQGTATGTGVGKQVETLADQGRSAAQAVGNIDYGLAQLDKARAGGINTGYFAPALTTAASAAKSLGIPPQLIGIDPSAIGNVQTARKTLAVVSGAILQQIIGKSDITDAKIEAFIHAQPGIETDPDAVRRVLGWARSQFVYEHEMAKSGMNAASGSGMLPLNWKAKYFSDHGFAPIYNPATGEMQQPDGQGPSREAPPAEPAKMEGALAVGTVKQGYRFKGGNPAERGSWERVP